MVDRLLSRKTGRKGKSNEDENDMEKLIPPSSQSSHNSAENPEKIYLDDMIRHSRDNFWRLSLERKSVSKTKNENEKRRRYKFNESFRNYTTHLGHLVKMNPKSCLFFLLCAVSLIGLLLANITNGHNFDHLINTDYSDIKSIYDLSLGKLDHWCLSGDDYSCDCEDPLEPVSRGEIKQWVKAHQANVDAVSNTLSCKKTLDVTFLGESIVEEWAGTRLGHNSSKYFNASMSFQHHFNTTSGGNFSALPLGINGDTVSLEN